MKVDNCVNSKVIFGSGRLQELAHTDLPGKKALICLVDDHSKRVWDLQKKVSELLQQNNVESVVYSKIRENPTRKGVMEAVALAKAEKCDFVLGLGGGSSIDTAKATAIMMENPGDLWDYASIAEDGGKEVHGAAPIVTVTTTCGTGTECDPWCVITNEETNVKLDFGSNDVWPTLSIIDPELVLSLPKKLTASQGLDALFHAVEGYIYNQNEDALADIYVSNAIRIITEWLPKAYKDGQDIEAREHMSFAACVLAGYSQAQLFVTSHHIIGQVMGGLYPNMPHGITLIVLAKAYYQHIKKYVPETLDAIGNLMGEPSIPGDPGQNYIVALTKLMEATDADEMKMSDYGVDPASFVNIAKIVKNVIGIDFDHYDLSIDEIVEILKESYK